VQGRGSMGLKNGWERSIWGKRYGRKYASDNPIGKDEAGFLDAGLQKKVRYLRRGEGERGFVGGRFTN